MFLLKCIRTWNRNRIWGAFNISTDNNNFTLIRVLIRSIKFFTCEVLPYLCQSSTRLCMGYFVMTGLVLLNATSICGWITDTGIRGCWSYLHLLLLLKPSLIIVMSPVQMFLLCIAFKYVHQNWQKWSSSLFSWEVHSFYTF